MTATHAFQCTCGALRAAVHLEPPHARALCYCQDCQDYAHYLKRVDDILDAHGGTDIIALPPKRLHFTAGTEHIQCMSLSPKGLLRWYAGCCRTPIGNTPRDRGIHYLGLIATGLAGDSAAREAAFGAPRTVLNAKSAYGAVPLPEGSHQHGGMFGIMRTIIGAKSPAAIATIRSSSASPVRRACHPSRSRSRSAKRSTS